MERIRFFFFLKFEPCFLIIISFYNFGFKLNRMLQVVSLLSSRSLSLLLLNKPSSINTFSLLRRIHDGKYTNITWDIFPNVNWKNFEGLIYWYFLVALFMMIISSSTEWQCEYFLFATCAILSRVTFAHSFAICKLSFFRRILWWILKA